MLLEIATRTGSTPHETSGLFVACVAAIWCVGLATIAGYAIRGRRTQLRTLRRCPRCAGGAVRALESFGIDETRVQVCVECGECGLRRRLVVSPGDLRELVQRLERDRRWIATCAGVMARDRTRQDFERFMRELRDDVAGADDFVARTGRRRPPACGRG
jgi:transcription elongation factor Elf1